jgi:hypothetical protein
MYKQQVVHDCEDRKLLLVQAKTLKKLSIDQHAQAELMKSFPNKTKNGI